MQPTHPFLALSIGAVITLGSVGAASSQTVPASQASAATPAEDQIAEIDLSTLIAQRKPSDSPDVAPSASSQRLPASIELAKDSTTTKSDATASRPASQPTPNDASETSSVTQAADASNTVHSDRPISRRLLAEGNPSRANATADSSSPSVDQAESSTLSQATQAPAESLPLPGAASPPPAEEPGAASDTDTPNAQPLPSDTSPTTPSTPSTSASTTVSAPEYLDSDPNPLLFPTQPEEVEIVGTQPITLEQAWELAQRNSRQLQASILELERTQAQLREAQAANDPTLQLQTELTGDKNQNAGNQFAANQDEINLTLGGTLQLNYDLFTSGTRSSNIRANEGQVRFQELQVETVAEQLRLDVANDYYDLQQADEQVRISQSALAESQRNLQDAQALERAGVGTRFDVLQAQVDVANSQQELTQNLSQQQIARRQLARRLNLAENVNLIAADPVRVAATWNLSLDESIVLAYRNRAELQQQLVQREISDYQRRAALGQLGPQVSLFANYSASDLLNGSSSNNSLTSSNNDNFNDTYSFGVRMNINLYDGGAARARADQQRANIAIAETQFADTRNQVRFDVEQAFLSLQANSQNISTTTLALQQATEALRLARLRFQAGVGTQIEVLRSQTELTRAEVNQLNAIVGYNRSLVQLQRAVSNLPLGNLAETP
ncbi:MAG TPA: TolC family protein [Crinalium sp.]